MSEFGSKETLDVAMFGAKLGNAFGKSLEDGKISLGDAAQFIPALVAIPSAVSGIGSVKDELLDLDEIEKQALIDAFIAEFEIPQEKAEMMIEDGIELALDVFEFAKKYFLPGSEPQQ